MKKAEESLKNNVPNFVELVDQELLLNIMRKIADATGMGIAAVDYCGKPAAGCVGYSSFCKHVQSDPMRKRLCEVSTGIGEVQAATIHEPYIYVCPHGLLEVSVPIVIDGEFLGGLVAGQVSCEDIPENVSRLASIFPQDIICSDNPGEKFEQTTKMTFQEFEATAQMIYLLITELFQARAAGLRRKNEPPRENEELKEQLRKDEISILSLQMNRNFLVRSMISIANMAAVEDAVKTNEMVGTLAKVLWDNMEEKKNSRFLCDELEMLRCYLTLQKQQVEDLEYEIDIPEDMMLQRIPSMLLFPVVDQAVYCGIRYKRGGGKIRIKTSYNDGFVKIDIEDNGLGIGFRELKALFPQITEEYSQEGGKSGIELAEKRLSILFPHNYEAKVELRRGAGARYSVQYPRSYAEGEE